MKKFFAMVVILAVMTATPGAAWSATVAGVTFEKQSVEDDHNLYLRGAGLLRYLIFKAYAGALYLPETVPSTNVLADVPKRLEISYFHAIAGSDFARATLDGIRKNVDAATFDRLESKIAQQNALYRDVKPGDRYALTYIPGKGTTLALNGKYLGCIQGAEFASALFAIWLGQAPISQQLKKDLLGRG